MHDFNTILSPTKNVIEIQCHETDRSIKEKYGLLSL